MIAALECVRTIVLQRPYKGCKAELARHIADQLPHGQVVDAVLCSRVVQQVDSTMDVIERGEYALLAAYASEVAARNPGLRLELGVTFGGQQRTDPEPYWRAWEHDAATPGTARATSSCARGPLLESDLAAFEYVAVINPAAGVLGRVMEGMLALDGTAARRFGQILTASSRVNGHNVILGAIFGRTENSWLYTKLMSLLFNAAPVLATRAPTVASDRAKGLIKAVAEFLDVVVGLAQREMALRARMLAELRGQTLSADDEVSLKLAVEERAKALRLHHVWVGWHAWLLGSVLQLTSHASFGCLLRDCLFQNRSACPT